MAGMLERRGRILEPAGRMWSVLTLSPSLMRTGALIVWASGWPRGRGFVFGPPGVSTPAAVDGGDLGARQVHLVVRRAGAAGEVAVERAQGGGIGGRRLAHADAGAAGGFQDAGAGLDQVGEGAAACD